MSWWMILYIIFMLTFGNINAHADLLSKPTKDQIAIACKVILSRTVEASEAKDYALIIILNQSYYSVCENEELPKEYSEYFMRLRQNSLAPHCFSLAGKVLVPECNSDGPWYWHHNDASGR